MRDSEDISERILNAVRRIPPGAVASYGQVAMMAGLPRRARLVGKVLRETEETVPWQRVLRADGSLAFPAGSDPYRRQRGILEAEGVPFRNGRVPSGYFLVLESDLDKTLWGISPVG